MMRRRRSHELPEADPVAVATFLASPLTVRPGPPTADHTAADYHDALRELGRSLERSQTLAALVIERDQAINQLEHRIRDLSKDLLYWQHRAQERLG